MPLQPQEIRVPFGGGVDQKTDHKQVDPGKLLELINGEFTTIKQISKRNGFLTPYSLRTVGWYGHGSDTIGEGSAIYRRGKELLITAKQTNVATGLTSNEDGWYCYSHDPDLDEWKNIGTRQPLSLDVETITEPTTQWEIPDVALAASESYACYVWLGMVDPADGTTLRNGHLSIVDLANNVTLIDNWNTDINGVLATVHVEGVHVTGIDATDNQFYAWFAAPSINDVYMGITDCDDLAWPGNPVVKITDLHEDMIWDVCTADHSVHGMCSVVAYKVDITNDINVSWFDEDGNWQQTETIATTPKGAITVFEAYDTPDLANRVIVAWQDASDNEIYAQTFTDAGAVHAAMYSISPIDYGDRIRNITGCRDRAADFDVANSAFCHYYIEYTNAANTRPDQCSVQHFVCEFDGTNPSVLDGMARACLASKAFEYEQKARVWVVHDSYGLLDDDPVVKNDALQNTYFLMSMQGDFQPYGGRDNRTDARCLGGSAGGQSYSQSLSAVVPTSSNAYLFAGLRTDVILSIDWEATLDSVVGITTNFAETAQPCVELGPTSQTGGGYIGEADGRFQENNFHLYPESLIPTVTAIAGVAVNWQYIVVYEWTDREGQIHRSQPSLPVGVGAAYGIACNDGDHVDIEVSGLPFGDPLRLSKVRCVLYRTIDGPGPVFYRLPETSHKYNGPGAASVTLADTAPAGGAALDTTIEENESLYTTGDVIGNICPPASSIINIYQDRVMLVQDEDPTNIWFSKLKKKGIAVSFADSFTKRITDGGPITAMVAMDSRQIVFKSSEIRAFSGPGPNDLGRDTFGEDHLVTTDVGCVDRASVVWTDKGVMFKSAKGIYLLGRNLQVNYIGAPVEDFNQYRVIKGELVENKNQVRFLLESSDMLVYDYLVNQWSVFEHPQSGETHVNWDTVDSAIWQDNYVMIKDDGTVFQESTDYLDLVDTYVPLDLTSGWVKLNGLQGYQRVIWISLLGEVYGTCTINYEVYYDYVETNPQTGSVTIDAAFAADPPAQFRIKPRFGNGRSQAFKVRLFDEPLATPAGSQKGYAINDFMIEIGKLPGVKRQGGLKTR